MNYTIRMATVQDIPALCMLMGELGGNPITQEGMLNRLKMTENSETDTIYIYEIDNLVKGVLVFRIHENIREVSRYGEIGIIVVHSSDKRNGIGKRLMTFAEQLAKQLNCKGTYLISGFARKDEAHRFYLELGYEITGYRFVKSFVDQPSMEETKLQQPGRSDRHD